MPNTIDLNSRMKPETNENSEAILELSQMFSEALNVELEKGHASIQAGRVKDMDAAFKAIYEKIQDQSGAFNSFSEVHGEYVEVIKGQVRLGYSKSDNDGDYYDFDDVSEIIKDQGYYQGAIIRFHDFKTGRVFVPFELEKNVLYGDPIFLDQTYYFLQADFNKGLINLYEYEPDTFLRKIEAFKIEDMNLYHLRIMGEDLHLVSSGDKLEIYHPYRKTLQLQANESVLFIKDDRLYISVWIEEGWDEDHDMAGPDYAFYDMLIIKDMDGNTLSRQRGNLFQHYDGSWWLS